MAQKVLSHNWKIQIGCYIFVVEWKTWPKLESCLDKSLMINNCIKLEHANCFQIHNLYEFQNTSQFLHSFTYYIIEQLTVYRKGLFPSFSSSSASAQTSTKVMAVVYSYGIYTYVQLQFIHLACCATLKSRRCEF